MNYELLEKLYKSGKFKSPIPVTKANEKYLEFPPLSELIEACGDRFYSLNRPRIDSNKWRADAFIIPNVTVEGSTPEEAVAKLWLELEK